MAYTNSNGQIRVGVRSGISNSPIIQPAFSASLLQSLYGVWNGDTTTNELSTSIFGAWNAEASGTSLDTSIFAVYNADGDANDSKGTNHGTAQGGLTYTTGKINQAFQFNGSNAYIQLPNNSFNFTGDFSASLWVNFPSMAWQNGQLIDNTCWDSSGSGTSGWRLYYLYGSLGFYIFRENGLVQLETYSLNQANVWYHIVITSSSSGMKIYLNGALSVSNTSTTKPNYPNVVSTRLGASRQNSQFTTCKMDGVSTWSKELTPDEVTQLYNSGNGAQYPYSSQSLPSSNDSVGTNHGSLMNGVAFSTGKVGNAFTFDGVNDYVSFPTNSWNSLVGTDLTISLWVKFTSTANQTLISNMSSPSINVWSGWEIRLDGGRPTIYMWNNSGTGVGAQGAVVSTNTWYHIVATRKKGSRTRIYINGSLAQTDTNTPDPSISGTYYPNIGHLQYSSSYHGLYMTNGSLIDSVNLWSKEISADEVTQLYNSGTGAQYPFTGTFSSAGNQLGVDNGTLMNGCYLSDGKIGKAFTFDGVNDYIDLPNNSMNFTGDFSVSGWINQSSIKSYHMIIGNQGTSTGNWHGWLVWVFNNKLTFDLYNGNSAVASGRWQTTTTLSTNTWIHFTITKKPGQAVKIYLDGVIGGGLLSGSNSANVTYTTTNYATIGLNKYSNPIVSSDAGYWHGKIDSLNVYQKELTQAEVTELYNSGNGKQITTTPIVQSGLVLNLDASRSSSYTGTGTTWTDISGNGNNGTLVNGPVFGTASGGVITFDGVNDYVSVVDSTSLRFGTGAYTINLWVKPTSFSGSKVLIQKGSLLGGWQLYFDSVGYLHFTQQFVVDISTILFSPNQWKNIVFTSNGGTDRNIYMYVNGVSTGTYTCTGNQNYNLTSALTIGADGVGNNYFLNGNITNVLLYNRALSTTEITQNFNATKSRFGL